LADPLPLETQTLYAELLEHLLAVSAARSVGHLAGSFSTKKVKGETYLYFQASVPGGATRQFYLGRQTQALERLVARFARERAALAPDLARVRRLAAQLRVGGATTTDAPSARVIQALADAGLFEAGCVLVGTHAFAVLANLLGVRWGTSGLRTQDVDVGTSREPDLDIAVPDREADIPGVLESLAMGFLPVPPLDPRAPSTSFKVRGQPLRVDLLCPARAEGDERPVAIPRFRAAAHPLALLDYVLEAPERAAALGATAVLINVPAPARFAVHKLLVAPRRAAAFKTKAEKDVGQAAEVLDVLVADRPGDVPLAWEAIERRGPRWIKAARTGLALLKARQPTVHRAVAKLLR
jgi:hypothetical protein